MINIYDINGLMFWSRDEIKLRRHFEDVLVDGIMDTLLSMNPAWSCHQIEAPLLTPTNILNANYTGEDIWIQDILDVDNEHAVELALRPETTPGSYAWAAHMMANSNIRPPFVVYQHGKSFRREIEQPTKHMRLKEFYQLEFQCVFAADTLNDYYGNILEPVRSLVEKHIGHEVRCIPSDRLPTYSKRTMDIEIRTPDKWMEVASISLRTDFPIKARFTHKDKVIEKDLLVCEIAVGTDRLLHCWNS